MLPNHHEPAHYCYLLGHTDRDTQGKNRAGLQHWVDITDYFAHMCARYNFQHLVLQCETDETNKNESERQAGGLCTKRRKKVRFGVSQTGRERRTRSRVESRRMMESSSLNLTSTWCFLYLLCLTDSDSHTKISLLRLNRGDRVRQAFIGVVACRRHQLGSLWIEGGIGGRGSRQVASQSCRSCLQLCIWFDNSTFLSRLWST